MSVPQWVRGDVDSVILGMTWCRWYYVEHEMICMSMWLKGGGGSLMLLWGETNDLMLSNILEWLIYGG